MHLKARRQLQYLKCIAVSSHISMLTLYSMSENISANNALKEKVYLTIQSYIQFLLHPISRPCIWHAHTVDVTDRMTIPCGCIVLSWPYTEPLNLSEMNWYQTVNNPISRSDYWPNATFEILNNFLDDSMKQKQFKDFSKTCNERF